MKIICEEILKQYKKEITKSCKEINKPAHIMCVIPDRNGVKLFFQSFQEMSLWKY